MRPKDQLIVRMIRTFDWLGRDCMARIDARIWAEYYKKKAKKLGVPLDNPKALK